MLKGLSELYFRDKPARARFYVTSFTCAFGYAVVNDLLLKRPIHAVAYESIGVCLAFALLLPLVYAYRRTRLESPTERTIRRWMERIAEYPLSVKTGRWVSGRVLTALIARAEDAVELDELLQDKPNRIKTLRALGNALYLWSINSRVRKEEKRFSDAAGAHQKSLKLAEEIGDVMAQAHAHFNLSLVFYQLKDVELVKMHARRAIELYTDHKAPEAKLVRTQLLEWGLTLPKQAKTAAQGNV
jgi:tetratricopeptide (TPR) repeat protein